MENFIDISVNDTSILNIPLNDLVVSEGKTTLEIKISSKGNYSSGAGVRLVEVDVRDLHGFVAGLTILPQGVGNGCDCEIKVYVKTRHGRKRLSCEDYTQQLHDPYVIWTDDGSYANPKLRHIQNRVSRNGVNLTQETRDILSRGKHVLAMDIDGFVSLFRKDVPLSFLLGLLWFQTTTEVCETHLARINKKRIIKKE